MILRFLFLNAFVLLFGSTDASALDASLAAGLYEPADGVVDSVFDTSSPVWVASVGLPRADGLSWASSLVYASFDSRVGSLSNDIRLIVLESGFRKAFLERDRQASWGIEPFFGGSLGAAALIVKPSDSSSGASYSERTRYNVAYAWEVGTSVTNVGTSNLDLEARLLDQAIGKRLFGNVNVGGRLFTIGFRYRFG